VVIFGIAVITIVIAIVSFPAELDALTVKLGVPTAVGVPVIIPVSASRLKPAGRAPLTIDHVNGVVPVAVNLWL